MTLDPKGCAAQEYEEQQLKQESPDWSVVSRTAVLADAEGLLTCYGVGEESTGQLTHAVIELCFTSSVRFLQPGLLLQASFRLPGHPRQHKAHSQVTPGTSVPHSEGSVRWARCTLAGHGRGGSGGDPQRA